MGTGAYTTSISCGFRQGPFKLSSLETENPWDTNFGRMRHWKIGRTDFVQICAKELS